MSKKNVFMKKSMKGVKHTTVMKSVNAPLYVKEAIDLIINKMPYVDVAKKYDRTVKQVYWLSSKCIKSKFKTLWDEWHIARKNKKDMKIPFYMTVASETLINGKSLEQIAEQYNKKLSTVKNSLGTLKKKYPYMWQLIDNNGFIQKGIK